jgi:phosphoribosylaminoimidazolecarboxamide formyltransferase/IMP cyclohydrolase
MAEDLKKMYRTVMEDHFPESMRISFGDQELVYRKRSWKFPDSRTGELIEKGLRYGENPGQESALYELVAGNLTLGGCRFIDPGSGLVSAIREEDMIQEGKHPGKINLTDLDNGLNILKYLMAKPAAVILKHNNPCGAAYGSSLTDAYHRANRADRIAAFGGCLAVNRPVDKATAALIAENYLEVVAAPDYEEGALDILKGRPNLRIIQVPGIDRLAEYASRRFVDFKSLMDGGLIVQQSPLNKVLGAQDLKPAETTHDGKVYLVRREPTESEMKDLLFGWFVEQGVTSNSVLYVKDECTVGIGTGEQDRVGVAEIAVFKAYQKYADALCFDRHGIPYKELELAIEKGRRPA